MNPLKSTGIRKALGGAKGKNKVIWKEKQDMHENQFVSAISGSGGCMTAVHRQPRRAHQGSFIV